VEYIKKVFNDSKELVKVYIIFAIIDIMITIWNNYNFYGSIQDISQLVLGILPIVYFIYIQTNSGKRNFKIANIVAAVVLMLDFVYYSYQLFTIYIPYLLEKVNLHSFTSTLSLLVAMAFDLYFVSVFILKDQYKIKIYKKRTINETICNGLILGYMIASISSFAYYCIILQTITLDLVKYFISLVIYLVLCILRTRYVYLYQKFKERR